MANPISKWFRSLLGKPQAQTEQTAVKDASDQTKAEKSPEEDSIRQDIEGFKGLTKKVISQVSTTVKPYAEKGTAATSRAQSFAGSVIDRNFLRKVIRIFFILIFLLILIFVALRLFKITSENGGGIFTQRPTPTPIIYQPYRPSIYADDPQIKKLEEDINVLEGEISGTNLRETTLNPPVLDFNISF